jgi:hypothetical protein
MKEDGEGSLTKFVGMFRADGRHNGIRKSSGLLRFSLVDELRDASPALALARRQRIVLRETLQQPGGGRLEILHDVGCGWRLGVRR